MLLLLLLQLSSFYTFFQRTCDSLHLRWINKEQRKEASLELKFVVRKVLQSLEKKQTKSNAGTFCKSFLPLHLLPAPSSLFPAPCSMHPYSLHSRVFSFLSCCHTSNFESLSLITTAISSASFFRMFSNSCCMFKMFCCVFREKSFITANIGE